MTTINLSKKRLIWFAMLIWYFEMAYLTTIPIFDRTYSALKMLGVIFLLLNLKKIYLSKMFFAIAASELSVWYSTYRMGTPIVGTTIALIRILIFCMVIEIIIKKDTLACIDVIYNIFELLILLNVFSMILFPNGLYDPDNLGPTAVKKYYLLGHQNSMGIYVLVALASGGLRLLYDKALVFKWRFFFLIAFSLFYVFKVWSVISIVGAVGLTVLIIFDIVSGKGIKIKLIWGILFNVVLFVLLTVEQSMGIISSIIVVVFHRDLTLSGRTIIWQKAWLSILKEPIWGVGNGQGKLVFGLTTAHNRYLNTLFTTGIVGLILLLIILMLLARKLKNTNFQSVRILTYYFLILLTTMQGESYTGMPFYVLIILAYHIEDVIAALESSSDNKKISFVLWGSKKIYI